MRNDRNDLFMLYNRIRFLFEPILKRDGMGDIYGYSFSCSMENRELKEVSIWWVSGNYLLIL